MSGMANQQLVLTAIGEDRTGIVGELTKLVSDCNCNIIDSRIAILGNEFTFLMLLSGDLSAINRIEHTLPCKGMELGLLTMMKRTSNHCIGEISASYSLEYQGKDSPSTLSKVAVLLAEQNIDINSLQSNTFDKDNELHMLSQLEINVPVEANFDKFKTNFDILCNNHQLEYILRRIK